MRTVLMLFLLGVMALALAQVQPSSQTPAASPLEAPASSCMMALDPNSEAPDLDPFPMAELLPSQMPTLHRAYFSMGCFWGSEAMLASCPGVHFTQVGFAGGTTAEPTYSAIGDHVETVEVLFDPEVTSYEKLLDHFWDHHNASAKPVFRQYASAIFVAGSEQESLALSSLRKRQAIATDRPILTAVQPLQRFYPAGAQHQKHYLQQDEDLVAQLPRYGNQRLETRLATKLNALAGRGGTQQNLSQSLEGLGIPQPTCRVLFARASWDSVTSER